MIAALFVREDSVYKRLGVDCWDIVRDARNYDQLNPVIAHPPCRAWGKLKHFAKPRPDEKELAIFAINTIRRVGGCLEHPYGSTLFKQLFLPKPGYYDYGGGYTLEVDQFNWGHKAAKKTWVYIHGCPFNQLPEMPTRSGMPEYVVSSSKFRKGDAGFRSRISNAEREATPLAFANWLIEVATKCRQLT